jgi:hypothetical protein
MALGSDNLVECEEDHEGLVNNQSMNSFISEKNEFTITRSFGDRKYSTMCFKPSEQNKVDIVITQGEYHTGKPNLYIDHIGSQDLRRKYSTKAKFGVGVVIVMLMVMLGLVVFCLLSSQPGYSGSTNTGFTTLPRNTNTTSPHSLSVSDGGDH